MLTWLYYVLSDIFPYHMVVFQCSFALSFRYKCDRKSDGISVIGPNGNEEGSDDHDISYDCDGAGNYTFEIDSTSNEPILPKCLERRKIISSN